MRKREKTHMCVRSKFHTSLRQTQEHAGGAEVHVTAEQHTRNHSHNTTGTDTHSHTQTINSDAHPPIHTNKS